MQSDTFDVVIVGSGAGGGTLASHLARRGVRVAIVEGGPRVNTRTDFNTHAMPFDFPNRQIPTMRPGKVGFDSERSRGVGGKTMLWNAVALRLSQRDFKGRTHDGAGEDWPVWRGHRHLHTARGDGRDERVRVRWGEDLEYVMGRAKAFGLTDVHVESYPGDGTTWFGTLHGNRGWRVDGGFLEELQPQARRIR